MSKLISLVTLSMAFMASAVSAQSPAPLADLLPDLILRDVILPRAATGLSHEAHFSPIEADEPQNPAVEIVRNFNKLMMVQLATFPLASSAGGFTYTFDSGLGTFRRASSSFGPAFAERSLTIGRGKFNAGFSYQHTTYDNFEGQNLDNRSIKIYLRHTECCRSGTGGGTGGGGGGGGGGTGSGSGPVEQPNGTRLDPPFEGDLIEAALSMSAKTDTTAFSFNYGLTNRWDVGLVVPVVHVDLDANVQATIVRLATTSDPLTHTFEVGNPNATQKIFQHGGTATGLGDVVLRSKYRVVGGGNTGLAGALDLRLPTGDQDNLLGSGGQAKIFLVQSSGTDRIMQHANIGYTSSWGNVPNAGLLALVGGEEPMPNEFNFAAGVEFVAESRVTLVADIVGRTLFDAGRLDVMSKPFIFEGRTAPETMFFDEFEPRAGNLNLTLGTVGVKFNPVGNFLFSANVLFPLGDTGLRSKFSTVFGLDYTF